MKKVQRPVTPKEEPAKKAPTNEKAKESSSSSKERVSSSTSSSKQVGRDLDFCGWPRLMDPANDRTSPGSKRASTWRIFRRMSRSVRSFLPCRLLLGKRLSSFRCRTAQRRHGTRRCGSVRSRKRDEPAWVTEADDRPPHSMDCVVSLCRTPRFMRALISVQRCRSPSRQRSRRGFLPPYPGRSF